MSTSGSGPHDTHLSEKRARMTAELSWCILPYPISIRQVCLYVARTAVGLVSHMDLPLDNLLQALAKSASTELLGAMWNTCPIPGQAESSVLANGASGANDTAGRQKLQKDGYGALCKYMQKMETPSKSCCGWRSKCSSCESSRRNDCTCVSWKEGMTRVKNGKGGWVWVKKTNETAYAEKIAK